MTINAMNALHRRLPGETALVDELVRASGDVPRWGADSEDSKTPMPLNMMHGTSFDIILLVWIVPSLPLHATA